MSAGVVTVARMRFGFVVPYANAREFAELAALGERCGWDAVFTWEAVWGEHAWVTLGAAAMVTERIRLGTLLTPAEVAALFRVSPKTVTRWADCGKITAVRTMGGHRRYRASEIAAWLEGASTDAS